MPPFFDQVHLHEAVSGQAVPVLEAIAANDNLRSLRRFERDDPPPYVSSTESSEHGDADFTMAPWSLQLPEDLQAIMKRPLDDDEVEHLSFLLERVVYPDDFYYSEAMREEIRFDRHYTGRPKLPAFKGLNGSRRTGVIVRHNVKHRWEKLGVWNAAWGFAGRQAQPRDDYNKWTWWWWPPAKLDMGDDATQGVRVYQDARELVARAVRLRQNLRRGEHAPVIPRSRLRQDTTTLAEAETFLISRPWFLFQIEIAEERERYRRLSMEDQIKYPYSAQNQVIKWWKERGDWRDEFNRRDWVTAWKWRHESPSPEPEDMAPLDRMEDGPLDVAAEMEFTPSEIDELETIDLPRSEQPEGFWVHKTITKRFPGMMADVEAEIRESERKSAAEIEKLKAQGWKPPVHPADAFFDKHFAIWSKERGGVDLFGRLLPREQAETSPEEPVASASRELPADMSERREDASPPHEPRLPRRRQAQDRVEGAQDQGKDQLLPPPPRRSARIAGMKRPAEALPSQAVPNKRPKRAAAPKTAAPAARPASRETRRTETRLVPARPPRKGKTETGSRPGPGRPRKTETEPRRGPGRPRKEGRSNTHSAAVQKKSARTPAPPRTGNSTATTRDTPNVPRRRGRPSKTA